MLGIVSALHLHGTLQTAARYYIGALAATILIIATNAGLIGISRLSWSLAEHRQLPGVFSRLHPRYRTPWFTIAFFSAIAIVLIIPGKTDFLGNLYSFGAMLSFTIAHVSIVALRLKDPARDRPYRAPWNVNWRGKPVPLTAVLGAIGTGAAFVSVVVLHKEARIVGTGWMIAGMAGYFLYRRRHGPRPEEGSTGSRGPSGRSASSRSPTTPRWCRSSAPTSTPRRWRRAAKLVGPDAAVEAVYVLKVPAQLPLDGGLEEEEREARRVLEVARLQARGRRAARCACRLIRTRNPGAAIVDEARGAALGPDLHHHRARARARSACSARRTRYVLANRPCRVIVEHDPATAADSTETAPSPARRSSRARPRKHSTRAKRGSSGRLAHRSLLGAGGRPVRLLPEDQSLVATSSSIVFTGPL